MTITKIEKNAHRPPDADNFLTIRLQLRPEVNLNAYLVKMNDPPWTLGPPIGGLELIGGYSEPKPVISVPRSLGPSDIEWERRSFTGKFFSAKSQISKKPAKGGYIFGGVKIW